MKTALIIGAGALGLYLVWRFGSAAGASTSASIAATGAYTPSGPPPGQPYPSVAPLPSGIGPGLAGVAKFISGPGIAPVHGMLFSSGGFV